MGHIRPAQPGAVAPRAEHGDDVPGIVGAQGGEHRVKAGAVVGVVDHHLKGGGDGQALGPPRHRDVGQPRPHRAVVQPQGTGQGHGGQGVGPVEFPRQGDMVAGRARHGEADGQGTLRVGLHGQGADVRTGGKAEGAGGGVWRELGGHTGPGRVIPVAHGPAALAEQRGLAGPVFVKAGVLAGADVVRGEVEEQPGGKGEAKEAAQLHGLGGRLQHHIGAPGVRHLPQDAVEGDGFGGGVGGVAQLLPAYVRPQGSDHAGFVPGGGEDVPGHVGGGGLALGAGDGDEGKAVGGTAVKFRRQQGQGGPGVVHGGARHPGGQGRGAHHGGGAPVQGLGNVRPAVGAAAGEGGEERAGNGLSGVAGEGGDVGAAGAVRAEDGQQL